MTPKAQPVELVGESRLIISAARAASAQEWDQTWSRCPYATYFHSREWAELWSEYTSEALRPNPILVTFSDGKAAILPLSASRSVKGLVTRYHSSPQGTFGGWMSSDDLGPDHVRLLTECMLGQGNLVWRLNPYNRPEANIAERGQIDHTYRLSLAEGFSAVMARSSSSHRRAARKAQRDGVVTYVAESRGDWGAFYEVYRDSLRRWGERASSAYGWELLDAIYRRRSENVKLWLAMYDQTVIAGALCLYAPSNAVYWLGGARESHFSVRPVQLLMYNAIEDACLRGHAWFDFNPSGGHEGVTEFKKRFGSTATPAPVVVVERRSSVLIERVATLVRQAGTRDPGR